LLYDRNDHALWLSVENVGMVRYNLDNDWSLFSRDNSGVPSSVIFGISEDRDGNIWCATSAGLLEISRKETGGNKVALRDRKP
jgi:ligand-binding sensor domain-containing protein